MERIERITLRGVSLLGFLSRSFPIVVGKHERQIRDKLSEHVSHSVK